MIVVEKVLINQKKTWKKFPLNRWSGFGWETEEDVRRARSSRCLIVPTRGGGTIAAFKQFDDYGQPRSFEESAQNISPDEALRGKIVTVLDRNVQRLRIWLET